MYLAPGMLTEILILSPPHVMCCGWTCYGLSGPSVYLSSDSLTQEPVGQKSECPGTVACWVRVLTSVGIESNT